jgi:hypothetical protein
VHPADAIHFGRDVPPGVAWHRRGRVGREEGIDQQEGQMSESGASSLGSDSELDDPGRDPIGLDPPRNPLGGPDQDSGKGRPKGSPGIAGESMMPESPTDEDGDADRDAHLNP